MVVAIVVVVVIAVVVASPIVAIPTMIVAEVAVRRTPVALVVPSALPIWLHPVRSVVRRTRPVAVVPAVLVPLRIPTSLDPNVIGTGLRGHVIRARRRRRCAELNAERNLRTRRL